MSQWLNNINQKRARDINLNIAAGAQEGNIILYEIPGTGLSTSDKEIAERHRKDRGYEILENYVAVKTLTQICQTYHTGPIHFLNIDVEGAEKDVLQGLNLNDLRPWIIVIESTLPNTQIENHTKWESLLTRANYEFVYFDGLNRFYIAQEQAKLKSAFNAPPNSFDDFIKSQQLYSEKKAQQAKTSAAQAEAAAQRLEAELAEARNQITQLHESNHQWWSIADQQSNTLKAVYASWSWRITWPLRKLLDVTKWLCRIPVVPIRWVARLPARFVSWMVVKAMAFAIKRDPLRLRLLAQVNKYPRLKNRLIMLGQTKGLFNQYPNSMNGKGQGLQEYTANTGNLDQLSPRARTIYFELKKAIAQRQRENE
jgi:FkbM family methyltransferase